MDTAYLAALLALAAAVAWGSGDFSAGLAARRVGPFYTVLISYTVGLVALAAVALARREPPPAAADIAWGALAGLAGMTGLGFLLRGFAVGRMGIVAPVSAVLAAAVPVVFAAFTEGLPRVVQMVGFGLALVAIWLLSRPEPLGGRPAGLGPALLAGLGFGAFFTMLSRISAEAVFWPLVSGRLVGALALVGLALWRRRPVRPRAAPVALLIFIGVIDAAGNLFFLLAVQVGRLDVAAVLASLYPGVTAGLAWLLVGERMAQLQVIGVAAAIAAIVLITV